MTNEMAGLICLGVGFWICGRYEFEVGALLFGVAFLMGSCHLAGVK